MIVVTALVVAVAGGLLLINTGGTPDPSVASDADWENPDVDVPEGDPEQVDLHEGVRRALVVIAADETTCWNAYIGSEPVQDCGRAIYEVVGAPRALGMNVKSAENEKRFLGIAAWSIDRETLYQSASASKKFATVALSVQPQR